MEGGRPVNFMLRNARREVIDGDWEALLRTVKQSSVVRVRKANNRIKELKSGTEIDVKWKLQGTCAH